MDATTAYLALVALVIGAVASAACSAEDAAALSRDGAYWRGPHRTPGLLACRAPAATDVTVVCDRWPDGSDLRRFGLDAVRLSGAETDHDKCLAVYRWVRRWMIYFSKDRAYGGGPVEKLVCPRRKNGYMDQPLKLLNVYGVHHCDGQSRVVEGVWRALGYRAQKVVRGGHTVAGCHYRDFDGVERWHLLDVSHSAVAFDPTYRRLLSPNELSTRWYSFYYQWIFCGHIDRDDHRMELAFRPGEKLERLWGNFGKPYMNNQARGGMRTKVPQSERGPYEFDFGNGRWAYAPDLSAANWADGLAEPPAGMAAGKLQPAAAGKAGSAVWHFPTPYIITDATVTMDIVRRSARDAVRLHLSVDGGRTYKPIWECPDDQIGRRRVTAPICPTYKVTDRTDPPAGFHSPFGRYAYRLKLELLAATKATDCRVEEIAFETAVQQNFFALPQLQPGRNNITVRGKLGEGAALKITYVWDDPKGAGRRNVTVVEKTPHTYEVLAAGKKWEDCVCKSITVEAVAAAGQGNRTLVKEAPGEVHELPPLPPAEDTTGRWLGQPGPGDLPAPAKLLEATKDRRRFLSVLGPAAMRPRPEMFDAFKDVAYNVAQPNQKHQAFVGMYHCDAARARAALLDIVRDRDGRRVAWSPGKDKADKGWGRALSWCCGATVIGYIAAEAGWREFLPEMLKVLADEQCTPHWGPRYGTIRVIGLLGAGDEAAAKAVSGVLTDAPRKEHGDAKAVAAEAAGRIGRASLAPALRKYVSHSYLPLSTGAAVSLSRLGDRSIIATMRDWLGRADDEGYRGAAAEALGNLADRDSAAALQAALEREPFEWIRRNIRQALAKLDASSKGP